MSSIAVAGLGWVGHQSLSIVKRIGQILVFVGRALPRAFHRPLQPRGYLYQLLQVGVRSLPLGLTMAAFAGMVLAFQFGYGLQRFGAKLFIGQTTVTALFRELGPILTALIVGGRIGAGIAAELAGMAVTEQLDAVRGLGADPLQRLVAPRIVAVMIALPLLEVCTDVVGFFGGMVVAALSFGVTPSQYTGGVIHFVTVGDFGSGLLKTMIFGLIIGAVACNFGMRARGGTEGVGRATTRAVVWSSLGVLVADLILTRVLLST